MKRSAPADGYDFGNKRQYRRTIWRRFSDECGADRSTAQCLLLPSSEGDEIEVAKARGFREENLHVVDKNAAIVANLKRRYPRIHTYGVTLSEACRRMAAKKICIDVANLDLCSNVNRSASTELAAVGMTGRTLFRQGSLLAVTLLRGRESHWDQWQAAYGTFAEVSMGGLPTMVTNDRVRLLSVAAALNGGSNLASECAGLEMSHIVTLRSDRDWGIYKSNAGTQTMLWAILRIVSVPWAPLLRLASIPESASA